MIQLFFFITTLISSLIFIQMNHPLAMGLMLLMQTMQICMLTGMLYKTFWFSYILFLIFLGGMLVLFIYVTSLASNEMFSLSIKMTISCIMMFIIMMMISIFLDKPFMLNYMENNEMKTMYDMKSYMQENSIMLNKLYNYPTNMMTIMLMNYLLITLIAVVKITNMFYGPLRIMN